MLSFCYHILNLLKTQIPSNVVTLSSLLFKLVSRLSEFAFLCVCFGRRIFYFGGVDMGNISDFLGRFPPLIPKKDLQRL